MINNKVLLVGIAIGLIIGVPVAYSATEPSIIINMIFGQSEKPIIVKDNLGVEVFSVDVDGTVFPAPVSGVTAIESLRFILIGEDTKTSTFTEDVDDQKVLAKWRVDFNSLQIDNGGFFGLPQVLVTHSHSTGFVKNDNSDFVTISFSTSFDDITIDDEFFTDGNGGSTLYQGIRFSDVTNEFNICKRTSIAQDECFITVGYHIPQGSGSTGAIKDLIFEIGIILPADTTITRLL